MQIIFKLLFYVLGSFRLLVRKIYERYYTGLLISKTKCAPPHLCIIGRPYISIADNASVSIGSNFICRSGAGQAIDNSCCSKLIVGKNAKLIIGDNTGISNTAIECYSEITIGSNVNIGAGTMIFDTDFHSTNWRDRQNRFTDTSNRKISPIHIGDCVFIGTRSIICKGVHIGNHSMVAAGSVVVKDIPSDELWGGNPACFIKRIE